MDDWQLLNDYKTRNSEEAFRLLADRYAGMVYHSALRQVRDPALAQDVTQAVFIALAHKAAGFSKSVVLSGWLIRATRFAVLNLSRQETRRRRHEQEAVAMETTPESNHAESVWEQISPHLDDALNRLSKTDREAVVIRFLESKSHKEVGEALGVSEEAAKRRVARAVAKLRLIFARRGVVVPALVLVAAFSTYGAQAAPSGLVSCVAAEAVAKTAVISKTLTLAKGTLKLMAWTKLQTTLVVAAGFLLAVGTTTVTIKEISQNHDYSWEVEKPVEGPAYSTMGHARPQVTILPAKFHRTSRYSHFHNNGSTMQAMELDVPLAEIIQTAYSMRPVRTVFEAPLPREKYDFIANLPDGAMEALGKAISKKFDLAICRQMRDTNVLILSVTHRDAPGLQPTSADGAFSFGRGYFSGEGNGAIELLVEDIENYLRIPVIDKTGLPGRFAINLKWDAAAGDRLGTMNQALIAQLGLELTQTNMPLEMLVVEKAR